MRIRTFMPERSHHTRSMKSEDNLKFYGAMVWWSGECASP